MGSIDLLEFAAVAFCICGLAFVVWEVVAKSPRDVVELLTDARGFAERPVPPSSEQHLESAAKVGAVKRGPAERRLAA